MRKFGALLLVIIIVIIAVVAYTRSQTDNVAVKNFTECAEAGYPIMESYPRQCQTPEGVTFTEEIVDDKSDLIRLTSPVRNAVVTSPLTVVGEARGNWFFEASFPVVIKDANGKVLGQTPAQAEGEWMTTEFVPFRGTLTFTRPTTTTGTLELQKDNASGLPENDDSLIIPIRFSATSSTSTPTSVDSASGGTMLAQCRPTGCSSQICSDEDVVSTCEYKAEYACYQSAKCERQSDGHCGWTSSSALTMCINQARSNNTL